MKPTTGRLDVQSRTHIHAASFDTTTSGIADSTISYGESLKLSELFPQPPHSTPSTPTSEFRGTPTNTFFPPTRPLVPLRKGNVQAFSGSNPTSHSTASPKSQVIISRPSASPRNPSRDASLPFQRHLPAPYEWHEAASSIDVDPTEDRLLPTSFITSLLQESKDRRQAQRVLDGSDAISTTSGISGLTFSPPPAPSNSSKGRSSGSRFSRHLVPPRPHGARMLPRPFSSIPGHISSDSESPHSSREHQPAIIRTASVSRNIHIPGTSVAAATLKTVRVSRTSQPINDESALGHEISDEFEELNPNETYEMLHPSACYSPAVPSTAGTQATFIRDSAKTTRAARVRNSVSSIITTDMSVRSKTSNISLQPLFRWGRVKPLPPIPLIANMPIAAEREHRKQDEQTSLPELVTRASTLHGLLEKGYHPHHSMNSRLAYTKSHPLVSDDWDVSAKSTTTTDCHNKLDSPPLDQNGRSCLPWLANSLDRHALMDPMKRNKRTLFIILVFLLIVIVVGAAVGAASHHNKAVQSQRTCPSNFTGVDCNLGTPSA